MINMMVLMMTMRMRMYDVEAEISLEQDTRGAYKDNMGKWAHEACIALSCYGASWSLVTYCEAH